MNKSELIDAAAKEADVSKATAAKVLDAMVGAVTKAVAKGDSVTLIGFGTFSSSKRAARVGRNPQTGKELKIAATTVPKFKAGRRLQGRRRRQEEGCGQEEVSHRLNQPLLRTDKAAGNAALFFCAAKVAGVEWPSLYLGC